MITRMTLFAAALLVSAALQARTPERPAVNDSAAPALGIELPATAKHPASEAVKLLPPPVDPLILDPLPVEKRPALAPLPSVGTVAPVAADVPARHTISWSLGLSTTTMELGPFVSLGYAYRMTGDFWIGGIAQYELLRYLKPYRCEIKLLEMNYWEQPLCRWLALRVGAGIGVSIYQEGTSAYSNVLGRIMIQWVVRLGRVTSMTFSPLLVGPSWLDIRAGAMAMDPVEVCCDYLQLGFSFRF